MRETVHFIPIATTLMAVAFAGVLWGRYLERGGTHLAWWGAGVVLYGAGTLTESIVTLFGWNEPTFRLDP